MLNDVTNFFII